MNHLKTAISLLVLSFLAAGCNSTTSQRTFDSPQAVADALADAARQRDRDRLRSLFGPELKELASGDEQQDDEDFQRLAAAYDRKHDLQKGADGQYTLLIGEQYWEFPAPIIEKNGKWMFDTETGVDEVISRRIGRNELAAINNCKGYVQAQLDYWVLDPDGNGVPSYATKFISSEGKRDGLYWPAAEGQNLSPLGPIIAEASMTAEEIARRSISPEPLRGYYYRILKKQSGAAAGGAMSYLDDKGNMSKGFALIAWPETYEQTGIMSFMVASDGKVLQKDLGTSTATVAAAIDSFNPDGWTAVPDSKSTN